MRILGIFSSLKLLEVDLVLEEDLETLTLMVSFFGLTKSIFTAPTLLFFVIAVTGLDDNGFGKDFIEDCGV